MASKFHSLVMVLLMAWPMCWCCYVQAAPAPQAHGAEAACPACPASEPSSSDDSQGRPVSPRDCCHDAKVRHFFPDTAAAPRLVLVDLQAVVWEQWGLAGAVTPPASHRFPKGDLHARRASNGPPLYQSNCAWLI